MVYVKELNSTLLANREGRLDKVLFELLHRDDFSRSMISRFIREQGVRVNEVLVFKPSFKIKKGDIIQIAWETRLSDGIEAQAIHFKVIWEDDDILVISKPPGVVVHPGTGNLDKTLVNGLVYRYPEIKFVGSSDRPGIVHRLDKGTSGIMIVARTQRAYQVLSKMIRDKAVYREYRVAVLGLPYKDEFSVSAPIYRDPHVPTRMSVVPWGKPAYTSFKILRSIETNYGVVSIMRAILSTGRTHQIRVHLRHVNLYPLGDDVYGNKISKMLSPRVFLHSIVIKFIHPFIGQEMEFLDPLPQDLLTAWKKLEVT